jgi:cytochrome d ubiquinol oxidase subunit II
MIVLGQVVGFVVLVSLMLYALGGGADFGAGVWNLFASGPRAQQQRELITDAIGPIWEANHVWLVLVVVLLFLAFPPAFAAIGIALHIPLAAMLVGIVLRGSAFVFRNYDTAQATRRRWNRLFSIGSVLAPLMLGVCVGALASGTLRVDLDTGRVQTDFFSQWLQPFPFAIGLWTLALFAFLAAVYLTNETNDPALQEDFRWRALISGGVVAAMARASFILSENGAPLIRAGLAKAWWSIPFHVWTGAVSVAAMVAVWLRKYRLARPLAMLQIVLILSGWGFAQFPYLVQPDFTFANAAAPDSVLRILLGALALGALLLFPSLALLFRVFKLSRSYDNSVDTNSTD